MIDQPARRFRCDNVWLDDLRIDGPGGAAGPAGPCDIEVAGGLITAIGPIEPSRPAEPLPGIVFPGFADAHSHIFHRALRGRTHAGALHGGSFWTWRSMMYDLAGRLDPDRLRDLATAGYAELVCAGYTAVGEFHYLHHPPGGGRYADPNAMGLAIAEAGAATGIGVTLLDTAYLAGGFGVELSGVQQRFSDGTAAAWADRVHLLASVAPPAVRIGAAVHSVRAVPRAELTVVGAAAAGWPLHVHVSEQPAENVDCLAATGYTPTGLLAAEGVLGSETSVVHATHLTDDDIALLAGSGVTAVICPTTEADLADGLPAIGKLTGAGVALACGGDQHVAVDPFAQARGIEYGERLATGRRGTVPPDSLVRAATRQSHRSIGSTGGRIAVGAPADLVAVRTCSPRTAGSDPGQLVMSATAADVAVVVIGGEVVARDGIHLQLGDPGEMLAASIDRAWR